MPSCFVWTWGKQFSGGQALLQRSYTWRSLCLPATLDISQGVVGGEGVVARLAGMEGPEYELGHRTVERSLCSERVFWDKYGPLGLDSIPVV